MGTDQEINVALTADFSSLQNGMRAGSDAVKQGADEMSSSFRSFGANAAILDDVLQKNIRTQAQVAAGFDALLVAEQSGAYSAEELATALTILEKAESAVAREAVKAAAAVKAETVAIDENTGAMVINGGVARELGVLTGEGLRGNWTRLEGSLITLANRANLLQYAFSPLGLTIGAIGLALVGMTASYEQASNREQEFTRLTVETGGALGVTETQFRDMASSMAGSETSITDAEHVLTKLGESGHISGDQLAVAGKAAIDMALVTGQSIDQCVDAISKLAKDPVKSVLALNDSYNFLTASQLDEIEKLDAQGDHMGAATRAMEIYAEAMKNRADEVASKADWLSQKFRGLMNDAISAWRAMGDGLRQMVDGQNEADKINVLNEKILELKNTWRGLRDAKVAATDQGGPAKELRALIAQRDALVSQGQERVRLAAQKAAEQRAATEAVAEQIAFNKRLSDGITLQDALTAAKKRAEEIHKVDPKSESIKGIKFDASGAVAGGEQWDATVKKLTKDYDKVGVAANHAADTAAKAAARAAHKSMEEAAHAANRELTLQEHLGEMRAKEIKKEEKERHDADLADLSATKTVADAKRAADRQALQQALSDKTMTSAQVLAEEKRLDAEEYAADVAYYTRKAQLDKNDVKEVRADQAMILAAQENRRKADLKAETDYQRRLQQEWRKTAHTIQTSIGGALKGMLVQGQTFGQAMRGLLGSVATTAIDKGLETLFNHQAVETAKTTSTVIGNATRTASDVSATGTSMALTSQKGIQSILTSGAEVIGRVWSSIAAIPYVGPFLAPAMAIAAGAAVYKLVGSIPSASGGWGQVPGDTLAQIHKDEMVLPADLAGAVRNMTNTKGGPRGDTYHIHATDARSFKDQLRRNPSGVAAGVKRARNRGHFNGVSL